MTRRGRDLTVVVCDPEGVILGAFELTGTLWNVKSALTGRGYFEEGRIAVVRRARGRIPVARFVATKVDNRHLWLRTPEENERTFTENGRRPR